MNNSSGLAIVGLAAIFALLSIAVCALLPRFAASASASTLRKFDSYEFLAEWAVHLAIGATMTAAFTTLAVTWSAATSLNGLLTGIVSGAVAFVIARPPLRRNARDAEFDGRIFCVSLIVHIGFGLVFASLMAANTGPPSSERHPLATRKAHDTVVHKLGLNDLAHVLFASRWPQADGIKRSASIKPTASGGERGPPDI